MIDEVFQRDHVRTLVEKEVNPLLLDLKVVRLAIVDETEDESAFALAITNEERAASVAFGLHELQRSSSIRSGMIPVDHARVRLEHGSGFDHEGHRVEAVGPSQIRRSFVLGRSRHGRSVGLEQDEHAFLVAFPRGFVQRNPTRNLIAERRIGTVVEQYFDRVRFVGLAREMERTVAGRVGRVHRGSVIDEDL